MCLNGLQCYESQEKCDFDITCRDLTDEISCGAPYLEPSNEVKFYTDKHVITQRDDSAFYMIFAEDGFIVPPTHFECVNSTNVVMPVYLRCNGKIIYPLSLHALNV